MVIVPLVLEYVVVGVAVGIGPTNVEDVVYDVGVAVGVATTTGVGVGDIVGSAVVAVVVCASIAISLIRNAWAASEAAALPSGSAVPQLAHGADVDVESAMMLPAVASSVEDTPSIRQ